VTHILTCKKYQTYINAHSDVLMDIAFSLHLNIPKIWPMLCKKFPWENSHDNGDVDEGNEVCAEECNYSSEKDLGGIDWYEVLQSYNSKPNRGDVMGKGAYNSFIEEHVLQGIEEEFNEKSKWRLW